MQWKVSAFMELSGLSFDAESRYIDFVSEVGELGKEMLTVNAYGERPIAVTHGLEGELGDCLFSLFALCASLNVDSERCLQGAIEKYEGRLRQKGHPCSGSEWI